ncbi:multiple sugar transport system permease protein [Anaerotaenia torta]|uniref:carbohydrate ABC transporter permease n=1 Tax=Anaerotaenia torta TaxID=433293 RepID=UPI003D1992B6
MKSKTKDRITITGFLLIPVILLILFSYYPLYKLVQISLSSWNGMTPEIEFIGFRNYKDILSGKEYLASIWNNMAYVITAIIQQFVGLFLAILLDSNLKLKKTFRAIIFMPYIINGVAVAFMFNYMYDFTNSPVNVLLKAIGLEKHVIRFISMDYSSNFSLSFISFWKYIGFTMVIFLAALQSIPREIYEAARVDGAGFFQLIRHITFPNIKNMFQISVLLSINGSLQAYFEPFVITKGGPNGRTATVIVKSLELAFQYKKFGKAAALGVVLLLIILVIVGVQRTFLKERDK